ncbi:hypothetical protein ACX0G9_03970 [Flavitalea flava]
MTFIRHSITGLLLLSLVAQSFSKAVIIADFYANQDYIARYLCVNRNNTAIDCEGKCQLKKRFKQEDSKDNENPERRSENKNEVISSKTFYPTGLIACMSFLSTNYPPVKVFRPVDRPTSHFHPPGC